METRKNRNLDIWINGFSENAMQKKMQIWKNSDQEKCKLGKI